MISTTTTLRVRYGETDAMKYVYYGNYAEYFEVGRVELFRSIGMPYDEIEKRGIFLPVTELKIRYLKPALYDDLLTIKTSILKKPGVRIQFFYEIYNDEGSKLTEAETTLYFLEESSGKPVQCPDYLSELIMKHWQEH